MKTQINIIVISFLFYYAAFAQNTTVEFPKLTGPYLGQKPPGNIPELFATGIVTTGLCETSICFSSSGDEVFFVVSPLSKMPRMMLTSKIVNSAWTEFVEVPFYDSERSNSYPFLSHDGNKLYFNAWLPKTEATSRRTHEIWVTERKLGEWSKPQRIDFGNEFTSVGTYPSVSKSGNVYFSTRKESENPDIYCAQYYNGAYLTPVKLSSAVNSPEGEFHLCIAPDESYIIFDSIRKEGSIGGQDLYISFKNKNGSWTNAINLGPNINSKDADLRPWISADGKYLFFISNRPTNADLSSSVINKNKFPLLFNESGKGDSDIYWVDASFIEELRKNEVNKK